MAATDVLIEVTSERYQPDDGGWRPQVVELWRSLSEAVMVVGRIQRTELSTEGAKGGTDAIVVTLLSAAALRALTDVMRLWLQRDRTRRISITLPVGPTESKTIRIDADTVSDATVREAMMIALEQGLTGNDADGSDSI